MKTLVLFWFVCLVNSEKRIVLLEAFKTKISVLETENAALKDQLKTKTGMNIFVF